MERIERENQKIAKKIFCLKSNLNKEVFKRDFVQHEAMKANMARIRKKKVPVYGGRAGGLPPLDGQQRQGSAPTRNSNDANTLDDNQTSDFNTVVVDT